LNHIYDFVNNLPVGERRITIWCPKKLGGAFIIESVEHYTKDINFGMLIMPMNLFDDIMPLGDLYSEEEYDEEMA
jgi:hypothetical protein